MSTPMDEAEAVRRFLGDRPESAQLREWREVLERRLRSLESERMRPDSDHARLKTRIQELQRQVRALHEEEAITGFVEESVRVTLAMGAAADALDEYEG